MSDREQLLAVLADLRDLGEATRYEITKRGGGFGPSGEHRCAELQAVIEAINNLSRAINAAQLESL